MYIYSYIYILILYVSFQVPFQVSLKSVFSFALPVYICVSFQVSFSALFPYYSCVHINMSLCELLFSHIYVGLLLLMDVRLSLTCGERWGAGVETQKNVRGEIGGWGRVPFNEPYAPSLSTIYDGA